MIPAAPLPERTKPWATSHDVQVYETDAFLAEAAGAFLADGVANGQPLIIIATPEHRRAFAEDMRRRGIDVDALVPYRDIVWLDARDTLALFMNDGMPDSARFEEALGQVFQQIMQNRTYIVVRAFGEMVDLLWREGNAAGALALERAWNAFATKYSFNLLCSYPIGNFVQDASGESFRHMCEHHGAVMPTESYLRKDDRERLLEISLLQQRLYALEEEVRRREEVERELRGLVDQRRRAGDGARTRELELRDFVENGLEPMHWVSADGTIIWANRAELDLLGYSRDEYVGRPITDFHVDQPVISDILARLSRGQEMRNQPARLRAKDGAIKRVLINSNVYWQDGKFVHTRCFTRDISDLPALTP